MQQITFLRNPQVTARLAISKASIYVQINAGLMPPGVPISSRAVGWPLHEIDAICRARLAGCTDDEIKGLVRSLMTARKQAA